MKRTRIMASALATLALVGVGAGTAHASTGPSKADLAAAVQAGKDCAKVTDDDQWESCNLGYVQMITNGRGLRDTDFTDGATQLVLNHATRPTDYKQTAPTKADKVQAATASAACIDLLAVKVSLVRACDMGMFTMNTGRLLRQADFTLDKRTGKFVVVHHSHKI